MEPNQSAVETTTIKTTTIITNGIGRSGALLGSERLLLLIEMEPNQSAVEFQTWPIVLNCH